MQLSRSEIDAQHDTKSLPFMYILVWHGPQPKQLLNHQQYIYRPVSVPSGITAVQIQF